VSIDTEIVFPIGGFTGPSFLDLAMVSLPTPEPGTSLLGVAAIASLGALQRRATRS